MAIQKRQVGLVHLALFELALQGATRLFALGDQDQARGIPIQAMDDTGPVVVAGSQFGAVGQHGIDQRASRMPRCGVDHHPRRLVHHQQSLVLVHNVQRDRLRQQFGGFLSRQKDNDLLALSDLVAGLCRLAIHGHLPAVDQPLCC